ncbi:MAG: TIGR02147 family protein [Bdellovibrionota bacterium]
METTGPLTILRSEFSVRSHRNPRYSLRAFAKSLGVSHTLLSLAMSGRRPLSRKSALRIAERLELPPERAATLLSSEGRKPVPHRLAAEFALIDLETFNLISDWIHYAILSLIETKGARFEAKWIARRLGLNEMQAKVAMDRLVSLDLVQEVKGKWRRTHKPIKIENQKSTPNTRNFQRQLIEKALESLDRDPIEIRDFSSITLPMHPRQIPYAKERIRQFRRELAAELRQKDSPKEVYNLTVQIYPISKEE